MYHHHHHHQFNTINLQNELPQAIVMVISLDGLKSINSLKRGVITVLEEVTEHNLYDTFQEKV